MGMEEITAVAYVGALLLVDQKCYSHSRFRQVASTPLKWFIRDVRTAAILHCFWAMGAQSVACMLKGTRDCPEVNHDG
jgi:hypothetical protein